MKNSVKSPETNNSGKINRKNSEQRSPVPAEFSDSVLWAAWLYFVDDLTQSEIAKKIGVSRVTVIKMLNEAKTRGLVTIQMNPEIAAKTALSQEFRAAFSLNSATIIPDLEGAELVPRLGKAGAYVLAESLQESDTIGVAWGRTVLSVAESIALLRPINNMTVAQVSASPHGLSTNFSPELCSSLLASRLAARNVNLLAPAIVSSAKLREMLLNEPSIKKQFDVIKSANRVLFGIGDIGKHSTLRSSNLYDEKTVDTLATKGAVAAIIGRFIDSQGQEVKTPVDDRMIGMTLQELRTVPYRLCVAGGAEKAAAIKATLKGGYATDIVIDRATAEHILNN